MKAFTLAAAIASIGVPALAGGPITVGDDPIPVATTAPVAAHDWSGPYVGLAYGNVSGDLDYLPSPARELEGGSIASLFAGYLVQRGNLVYGGELAYSRPRDTFTAGFPAESVDSVLDLKGKVGFSANRALFYGVLGYSSIDYAFTATEGYSTSGIAYGVGVDFALTQRLTAGLEYLARKTDGDTGFAGQTAEIDLNTLSLRVGFSF